MIESIYCSRQLEIIELDDLKYLLLFLFANFFPVFMLLSPHFPPIAFLFFNYLTESYYIDVDRSRSHGTDRYNFYVSDSFKTQFKNILL